MKIRIDRDKLPKSPAYYYNWLLGNRPSVVWWFTVVIGMVFMYPIMSVIFILGEAIVIERDKN